MTSLPSPTFVELLATARAAVATGDTLRARHYFRKVTEIEPEHVEAWLGLAATTAVLGERRRFYAQALTLDPGCVEARAGIAQIDELLAAGSLIRPRAELSAPPIEHVSPVLPRALVPEAPQEELPSQDRNWLALATVSIITLAAMWGLTTLGIMVFSSFWGFLLAFMAGPAVSELMLKLTARPRRNLSGRPLQIACGSGMALGGLLALVFGGAVMGLLGMPLLSETVVMAQSIGLGNDPNVALMNNPGMLIFISSATVATIYRI
jgi:hypothetical protein